ncbi:hypothetical protein [Kaistella sp.]|uniref:hypothetical protein n=1 Tax=Kaistella sp. TaxID=2782235 RepID=UPI003C521807
MSILNDKNRKSALIQVVIGVFMWLVLYPKKAKKMVLFVDYPEPVGVDYVSTYFKDSEYFGKNVIPLDYYNNWLLLAMQLDRIRTAFGVAIVIKKGFTVREEKYNTCQAVEFYPQNNNVDFLSDVINVIDSTLKYKYLKRLDNKNFYLEI